MQKKVFIGLLIDIGFWRFLDDNVEYITLACYPPRPDTYHEGGLVGLNES
jgi:hypothetical protein